MFKIKIYCNDNGKYYWEDGVGTYETYDKALISCFRNALQEFDIKTFPHTNGFFLSIPVEDPENTALTLSQNGVYLTTVEGGIRVAISGVPSYRLRELAEKIADVIKK